MADIPEWVKVGQQVVFAPYGFQRWWGELATITKVHKDGRFFVNELAASSFRPNGEESAYEIKGRSRVHPFFGEHKAAAEKSWAAKKARTRIFNEVKRLEEIARSHDDDALLAAAANLPKLEEQT